MGTIYNIIVDTLNAYERKEDISDSPFIQWGRQTLLKGAWWYGAEKAPLENREQALQNRQQEFLDLYLDIKNNGYNDSVISIFFDDGGNIEIQDGFHRLSIMAYLGMDEVLNCMISPRKSDFPLVETITKINNGKNLYQPCDDKRLNGFKVWRKDSYNRLNFILENITGTNILDIGCSEGFFSRELVKQGFQVTALDVERKRLAVARYLSIINNLELNYHRGSWQKYIGDKCFDSILFLSVFHHDILGFGVKGAFKQLEMFRERTQQLFFEAPISSMKVGWLEKNKRDTYDFTEEEFKTKIEEATQMNIVKTWYGIRPLYLLEPENFLHG